ncbi:MAG: type II toxin-antitoxin system VapC family toxin [Pseudonocardiaceae bacterium]
MSNSPADGCPGTGHHCSGRIRVLPVREADARRAGAWRREHAARGVTLHQADCLIAAVTAGIGARLATGNVKDFPMPEVTVEEWPPGP